MDIKNYFPPVEAKDTIMKPNLDDMDIALVPDTYSPAIDELGNYCDSIPIIRHGIYCPCGGKKDKVYESKQSFVMHTKTKCHQKWLDELSRNKQNYYEEVQSLKQTVQSQRLIIARLERDVNTKIMTVDILTRKLAELQNAGMTTADLLDI
jgi:hypothetical protein